MSSDSYAASTNATFKAQTDRFIELRDQTWTKFISISADIKSGKRTMPTLDELLALGKLDAAKSAMAGASEAEKIEWEYAATVRRDNPIVASLMALLGADAQATDEFFRAASLL